MRAPLLCAPNFDASIYLTLIHECHARIHAPMAKPKARFSKRRPSCEHAAAGHRSAAAVSAWNTSLQRGRRISARPTSVIAQRTPHASTALPPATLAKQMKSVITLDLWLNRLWQHCKVVNAIGLRVCISVFENKSSSERTRCGLHAAGTVESGWLMRLIWCLQWKSGRQPSCASRSETAQSWDVAFSPFPTR